MKRWITMILVWTMLAALCACHVQQPAETGKPTEMTEPAGDFLGLVLKAPSNAAITLYTGFSEGTVVLPTETHTVEGYTYRCYADLDGAYRYQLVCPGYYTVTKNIPVSAEDNQKRTLVEIDPEKMAGNGWEPDELSLFADVLTQGLVTDDISQWPEYADAFTTPWFTQTHGAHQMTTQSQMEEYLRSLDDADDQLYLYSAGTTGIYSQDIPLAVLTTTDLTGVETLEEMAKALDNGKPTVLYRGQIHGNEPAGGEAALAVITLLDGVWSGYLDNMNICVVPRGNPDSAQDYYRNVGARTDPNRDSLELKTVEVAAFQKLSTLLSPELIIDSHEYQAHAEKEAVNNCDVLVGIGFTTDNGEAFRSLALELGERVFTAIDENGLSARYYEDRINSINANVSRGYAALQGTPFVLIESRGIGIGCQLYPRRIVSHVVSVESLFDYVSENGARITNVTEAERMWIVSKGSTYSEDNRITLETGLEAVPSMEHTVPVYSQITGQKTSATAKPKENARVIRDVAPPTAYVIPAGKASVTGVLRLMDRHGISYTFIPEGSTVLLRQYSKGGMLEETAVTFPEGAYVLCRNQIQGQILCQLMEPEVPDHGTTKATLVNQGMIPQLDGGYALYGYVHDLNANGFIDVN